MSLLRIPYMIKPAMVFAPTFVFIFCRMVSMVRGLRKTSLEISSVVLSCASSLNILTSFLGEFNGVRIKLPNLAFGLQFGENGFVHQVIKIKIIIHAGQDRLIDFFGIGCFGEVGIGTHFHHFGNHFLIIIHGQYNNLYFFIFLSQNTRWH